MKWEGSYGNVSQPFRHVCMHAQGWRSNVLVCAATTKCLRLHALGKTDIYSPQFWRLAYWESRCWVSGEGPLLLWQPSSPCILTGEGAAALWVSLLRTQIPSMRAPPARPSHPAKAPACDAIALGLGLQHTNFGGTQNSEPSGIRWGRPGKRQQALCKADQEEVGWRRATYQSWSTHWAHQLLWLGSKVCPGWLRRNAGHSTELITDHLSLWWVVFLLWLYRSSYRLADPGRQYMPLVML